LADIGGGGVMILLVLAAVGILLVIVGIATLYEIYRHAREVRDEIRGDPWDLFDEEGGGPRV
jgi:hypothetical protein